MYLTAITGSFSAAHYLREYRGKCEHLHGHNWKVEVTVQCERLDKAGMGLDFRMLKKKTAAVLEALDHSVLNELPAFKELNPSSEHLAFHIFSELEKLIGERRVRLRGVKVWESESSWAEYLP